MSIDVSAPVTAAVAKKAKTVRKPKVHAAHPPFGTMIVEAIKELKERHGSSRQAILKHIKAHHKVDDKVAEVQVRRGLLSAIKTGKIVRTKGAGASGSFKLSERVKVPAAKETAKPKTLKPKKSNASKKTVAAKPKKASAPKKEKVKTPKKPKAMKPKKVATKPKKPAVKKTPKKAVKK